MVFKGKGLRHWMLAGAVALGLAACGGGDTVVQFTPTRMVAFGDELSLIQADQRKFTINALNATTPTVVDCLTYPLWVQVVAKGFGMAFSQCPDGTLPQVALMRAANQQTVAQMVPLIDAFLASDAPKDQDLVTMLVGMHDVLELYNESPRRAEDALMAELTARGTLLAQQVNRVAFAGPAVVVSTIPDIGKTPFANSGGRDAALLTRMTGAFNTALRINMVQDGRMVGIVFGDAEIVSAVRFPGSFGYVDVSNIACTVALPDCTTATLTTTPSTASGATWLWADDRHPSPQFHARLGQLALSRAVNNPF